MADEHQDSPEPPRLSNQPLPPKRRQQPIERTRSDPPPGSRQPRRWSRPEADPEDSGDEPGEAPDAPPIRGRRFSRRGTINGEDTLNELLTGGQSPAAGADAGPQTQAAAPGPASPTAPAVSTRPATGRVAPARAAAIPVAQHRRKLMTIIAGAQVFGLTLLGLGFAVGWLTFSERHAATSAANEAAVPAPSGDKGQNAAPTPAVDYALQAANSAMKAQAGGDFGRADQLFADMKNQGMSLPGLNYRLGLLALGRADFTEFDLRLRRSISEGEEVVGSHYALASYAGSRGNYTNASQIFEAASHAAPFSALPFFCWAECLRRDGKTMAAIQHLDEALDRPLLEGDARYVRFKRELAGIESGHDADIRKEVGEKLRGSGVPGDIYMLAAAIDIIDGAYPAAAEHLAAAARIYPPEEFALKVADYFYQAQTNNPALTASLAKRQGMPKADPAAWGIKEADPGAWPVPKMIIPH